MQGGDAGCAQSEEDAGGDGDDMAGWQGVGGYWFVSTADGHRPN